MPTQAARKCGVVGQHGGVSVGACVPVLQHVGADPHDQQQRIVGRTETVVVAPLAICEHWDVNARQLARLLGAAVVTTWAALLSAPILIASASAASCPDVEVTFARATNESPGVGGVGQAVVDSLRSQVGDRSVGVYPVNYPATEDWAPSASAGASDASAHVQSMAANCPNTRLVLGGYSQGAMVIDLITIAQAPVAGFIPASLPADVADHVAAVAVFGNPTDRYLGGPISAISPLVWA